MYCISLGEHSLCMASGVHDMLLPHAFFSRAFRHFLNSRLRAASRDHARCGIRVSIVPESWQSAGVSAERRR